MPTVLRVEGFQVRIYTRDHRPAHVHVWKPGDWARIDLPTGQHGAQVVAVAGMSAADVVRAVRIVEAHVEVLMEAWERYHGDENAQ
ncbi:MAG: DUF4160 domain-containing protein [Pseudomonas sp.]